MSQYLLLLHESPAPAAQISPEEIQGIIAEYTAWRDKLAERNQHVSSNKLRLQSTQAGAVLCELTRDQRRKRSYMRNKGGTRSSFLTFISGTNLGLTKDTQSTSG